MMYSSSNILAALALVTATLASEICSPATCVSGKSSSLLLAHDPTSSTYLIPGTYSNHLDSDWLTSFNQTTSRTPSSLTITPPSRPIAFGVGAYNGDGSSWSDSSWKQDSWGSLYLPSGWYAVLDPGNVLWGAIPDQAQLPGSLSQRGISKAASSACNPPCGSFGVCTPSGNLNSSTSATCTCAPGWTGAACDICQTGFFGPSCSPCGSNCTVCDDGLSGTGQCIGTSTNATTSCNCLHGSCTSTGDCLCAAGYTSANSTSSALKCSTCASGFFQDRNGNCLACPLGCGSCALKDGTASTPTCKTCITGLSLSTSDPAICQQQNGNCGSGSYYDSSSSSCKSCSPACSTCTGPSASDCLACTSPRANLAGNCVSYDASGVCDPTLSGLSGSFVVNNQKQRCDSCPAGCSSCSIPSFSAASSYDSLRCTSCQDGYLMQDGRCVKTCTGGYFLPTGTAGKNGTCQACDSSCGECLGSATYCTKCPTGFASNGKCSTSCPTNTIPLNGTCGNCHPDCSTCSTPNSATSCLTCPSSRPIRTPEGRCIEYCPSSSFFDKSSNTCTSCDPSCGSCISSGSSGCTTCRDGNKLNQGKCIPTTCDFAIGLGLCLSDFVENTPNRKLGALAIIPIFAIIGLVGWWYVRKERRKTREDSKRFRDAMETQDFREQTMRLRLERVFGFERVQHPIHSADSRNLSIENKASTESKKRLRELLLPSKRRDMDSSSSTRKSTTSDDLEMGTVQNSSSKGLGLDTKDPTTQEWRQTTWNQPPPPYVPSEAGSRSSIAGPSNTSSLYGNGSGSGNNAALRAQILQNQTLCEEPKPKTIITSMGSPPHQNSTFAPLLPTASSLRPPLRTRPTAEKEISVTRNGGTMSINRDTLVQDYTGQSQTSNFSDRSELRRLWPALKDEIDELDDINLDLIDAQEDVERGNQGRGRFGHGYI